MKTIYKYELPINDEVTLDMPSGAEILCVQEQHQQVMLWAVVNHDNPVAEKRFYMRGTGHPMYEAENANYISSVQLSGGALVFHVFEQKEKADE